MERENNITENINQNTNETQWFNTNGIEEYIESEDSQELVENTKWDLESLNLETYRDVNNLVENTRNDIYININLVNRSSTAQKEDVLIDRYDNSSEWDWSIQDAIRVFYKLYDENSQSNRTCYIERTTDSLDFICGVEGGQEKLSENNRFFDEQLNFLNSLFEAGQTDRSPLEILRENYENQSEQNKIELAMFMSIYMGNVWYDSDQMGNSWDVSSQDMWDAYINFWVAGVCRHHHSEVAKFLESVWFNTWIISTTSWGNHSITRWRNQDGKFFFIDYWNYYESSDPKELKARYLAEKWSIKIREEVWDARWKLLGFIQTDLEELFESTTSSINTGDSLEYSRELSREWLEYKHWFNIDWELDTKSSKSIDLSYANSGMKTWVFFNRTNSLDYANYDSYWTYLEKTVSNDTFWTYWVWLKLSKNYFEWENWKTREFNNIWFDFKYYNQLFDNWNTNIWLWAVHQFQRTESEKNNNSNDHTLNYGASLNLEQSISQNLVWNINLWYWADISRKNIRVGYDGWTREFEKKSIDLGLTYDDWNMRASSNISGEKWLWYEKTWFEANLWNQKGQISFSYENLDNSDNPFLLNEITREIGMTWNIFDTLSVSAWIERTDNWINQNDSISIWMNWKL